LHAWERPIEKESEREIGRTQESKKMRESQKVREGVNVRKGEKVERRREGETARQRESDRQACLSQKGSSFSFMTHDTQETHHTLEPGPILDTNILNVKSEEG